MALWRSDVFPSAVQGGWLNPRIIPSKLRDTLTNKLTDEVRYRWATFRAQLDATASPFFTSCINFCSDLLLLRCAFLIGVSDSPVSTTGLAPQGLQKYCNAYGFAQFISICCRADPSLALLLRVAAFLSFF